MPRRQLDSLLGDTEVVSDIRDRLSRGLLTWTDDTPLRREADLFRPRQIIVDADIFGERVPERIVLEKGRPALLIEHDTFEEPDLGTWRERLNAIRAALGLAIQSVGRVELHNHPTFEWNGTAWMIDESVMVTNRHVALLFAEQRDGHFTFRYNALRKEMRATVDLKEEHGVPDEVELSVTRVLHIEDDSSNSPDLAFLEVEAKTTPPKPIPLANEPLRSQDLVAVIGYPSFDPNEIPSIAREIFGGIYAVKRLSPGMVINGLESDGMSFSHDCTTLAGNSGSVVVSLISGNAVGIHYAGASRRANYAITASVVSDIYRRRVADR